MTKGEVWRFRADIPLRRELKAQRAARFARMPLVSVVVPLYNTPPKFLREMMRSVLGQTYAGLELVLADASDAAHGEVEKAVRAVRDARVRYIRLAKNGGIAENTNAALAAAQGEYIALLDHDDVLTPNALYEAVKAVNEQGADFVYSDEIVLDSTLKKLGEYHFKPDFSPDTLRGCNYITHLAVFSRALLAAAGGGERAEFDGAQDFDLILRLTERAQKVAHVPKVLYWWRGHGGSTASGMQAKPYALAAGAAAVEAQLLRLGMPGRVEPIPGQPPAHTAPGTDVTRPGRVTVLSHRTIETWPLSGKPVPERRLGRSGGAGAGKQFHTGRNVRLLQAGTAAVPELPRAHLQRRLQFQRHQQFRRAACHGRTPAAAE